MKNKKVLIVLAMLFLSVICIAAVKDFYKLATTQDVWVAVDATTSSGTEPTDLAVDERTYTTITAAIAAAASGDDEISIYQIPYKWNSGRFRCIGITDNQSVTHQIYLGTKGNNDNCELSKAGQLAWTVGTQVSETSTYEFADAVTVTSYGWTKSWSSSSPGSEMVAEAVIDFQGADILVVVTTTAGCDCKLLMKGY